MSSHAVNTYDRADIAQNYDTGTPKYPQSMVDKIIGYLRELNPSHTGKFTKMLDVGCGTGKSTKMFSSYFNSVLGTDISPAMIEVAKQENTHQNIAFQTVADGKFPCSNDSLDMVTAGGCIHLLDVDNFVKESMRVLTPNGLSVMYAWLPTKISMADGNAGELWFHDIYIHLLDTCKAHPGSYLWLNAYKDIYSQIDCETKTWIPGVHFIKRWSLLDLRRYITSYADYVIYMERENPITDPTDTFMDAVKENLKLEEDDFLEIKFEIPIIVFHKL